MGDAHAAQGDSELDGTAIETSITGRVKITLHKKAKLPKIVQVGFPTTSHIGMSCTSRMPSAALGVAV